MRHWVSGASLKFHALLATAWGDSTLQSISALWIQRQSSRQVHLNRFLNVCMNFIIKTTHALHRHTLEPDQYTTLCHIGQQQNLVPECFLLCYHCGFQADCYTRFGYIAISVVLCVWLNYWVGFFVKLHWGYLVHPVFTETATDANFTIAARVSGFERMIIVANSVNFHGTRHRSDVFPRSAFFSSHVVLGTTMNSMCRAAPAASPCKEIWRILDDCFSLAFAWYNLLLHSMHLFHVHSRNSSRRS